MTADPHRKLDPREELEQLARESKDSRTRFAALKELRRIEETGIDATDDTGPAWLPNGAHAITDADGNELVRLIKPKEGPGVILLPPRPSDGWGPSEPQAVEPEPEPGDLFDPATFGRPVE